MEVWWHGRNIVRSFARGGSGDPKPVGVGEAGEASASPLFSHQIKQYSEVTHIVTYLHASLQIFLCV